MLCPTADVLLFIVHCVFPNGHSVVLCTTYFPCASLAVDYDCELTECLGFTEACLNMVDYDSVIVLGDMNFECSLRNRGYRMFKDFCSDVALKPADSLCASNIEYTYHQEFTGNNSVIDHIFVSANLTNKVKCYSAINEYVNFSDHSPVACDIVHSTFYDKKFSKCCKPANRRNNSLSWHWDKADLSLYYFKTLELSQFLSAPTDLLGCECGMFKCVQWSKINEYYDSIIHVLQKSMYECVPAVRSNFYKSFWTEELTAVKQASIDAHNLWRLCDAPRSGLVNKIRLESKYKYKLALKQAMINNQIELDDEI